MKSAKLFGTTALACLFVVACAKSNKEEQARLAKGDGSQKTDTTISERGTREPLKIDLTKEDYKGDKVILTAKDAKNTGLIKIGGKDAQAIFDRMRLKEDSGSTDVVAGKQLVSKKGKGVECRSLVGSVDSAECYIYIDYKTGNLLAERAEIQVDEQAKEITEAYNGTDLSIVGTTDQSALLSIKGTDAQALYQTMTVAEAEIGSDGGWYSAKEKLGEVVNCSVTSVAGTETVKANQEFICTLRINPVDGTIKPAETKSVKKGTTTNTEEKAEEKKEDEAPADEPAAAAPEAPTEASKGTRV